MATPGQQPFHQLDRGRQLARLRRVADLLMDERVARSRRDGRLIAVDAGGRIFEITEDYDIQPVAVVTL